MMPRDVLPPRDFVAIDFETASHERDSACAVALVKVENCRITHRVFYLIRPPRRDFVFTYIHGITWRDVADKPTFGQLWPSLDKLCREAGMLVAHNASFDRSVLNACCMTYGLMQPQTPFLCTVRLARQVWNLHPTKLPDVCRHLGIALNHHNAASDAEACAQIVIAAGEKNDEPNGFHMEP